MLARSIGSGIKSNKRNKEIGQMRKEREVLFEKIKELNMQCDAEVDKLGTDLYDEVIKFRPYFDELETKLANTYNISLEEYRDIEHKRWMRKYGIGSCYR